MARRRNDDVDPLDRVFESLDEAAPGLHDLDRAAETLPPGLPPPLIDLYARCDGARLFVDAIEILPSHEVTFDQGRWRFALVLLAAGAAEDARNELEQVVADDPVFAWAWLDLARVSELLGEIGGAIDEARMAAEAAEGVQHPQAGYFWSQVARLATRV